MARKDNPVLVPVAITRQMTEQSGVLLHNYLVLEADDPGWAEVFTGPVDQWSWDDIMELASQNQAPGYFLPTHPFYPNDVQHSDPFTTLVVPLWLTGENGRAFRNLRQVGYRFDDGGKSLAQAFRRMLSCTFNDVIFDRMLATLLLGITKARVSPVIEYGKCELDYCRLDFLEKPE